MINTSINKDPSNNEYLTAQYALNEAVSLFKKAGIESSRLEAELLLAYAMGCKPIDFYIDSGKRLEKDNVASFAEIIRKRLCHMPIQYILGHTEFMSLDFIVDNRVLIPRPETELIVESVLQFARKDKFDTSEPMIVFDIGTGSGNIGVSIAVMLENARVYSCDISPDSLSVAIMNAERHNVRERMCFFHGHIFDALKTRDILLKADFIVSNPPYVAEEEWGKLQPEIVQYEPKQALIGGEDGLDFYRTIISEAGEWLKDDGYLILEIGERQLNSVQALIEATRSMPTGFSNPQVLSHGGGLKFIEGVKDLQGIDRIVVAQKTY